jgi:hypothetical protein
MAMRVPAEAATLESEMVSARIGAAAGGWRLSLAITGGPRAHPRAVGGYRVQIHMERETGVLGLEDEQPVEAGALTWQVDVAGAQPTSARVALVLVDPIGRAGVPLFIEAGA